MSQMKMMTDAVSDIDRRGQNPAAVDQSDIRLGKVQVIPVQPSAARSDGVAETLYRGFEITMALAGLIVAMPLMLAIGVIIRMDSPGPALFRHRRPAQSRIMRGRELEGRADLRPPPGGYDPDAYYWAPAYFKLVKFRTMYSDARTRFPSHFPDAYAQEGFRSCFPHVENDPRITRVGKILRKLSLDELPNLWSVLSGDIRLVGPRPELPQVLQYHTAEEMMRFTCKPGITGLAQISGRKMLSWGDTLALDLEYIKTRTIWLDLKIIVMTITKVITAHGAM